MWRPVLGYEGLYIVSSNGQVVTLGNGNSNFSKLKKLGTTVSRDGYHRVQLYKDGVKKIYNLARVVYSSFHGEIPKGFEVNHIDENKSNNSIWNLNLMTKSDNIRYGTRGKRAAEKLTNGKCSKPVIQYTKDNTFVKYYQSISEVKRQLGYNTAAISWCCMGKRKTAYGYKWSYAA